MVNYRKNLLLVLCCAVLGAPGSDAFALGLGKLEYTTHLGEPLKARIDLIGVEPDDAAYVTVRLASPEDFSRFGITYSHLDGLDISVQSDSKGHPYVLVQTRESVNEPILQFVLEARGDGSTVLSDYTVLLDPAPAAPVLTSKAPDSSAAAPLRVSPVPPRSEARRRSSAASFGPTQRNDTLWSIAKDLNPSGATIEQTMLALVRENPDAFYDDNVNRLKAGSTLKLPDDNAVHAVSAGEAAKQVRQHYQQWLAYKRKLAHGKSSAGSKAGSKPPELANDESTAPAAQKPKTPQLVLSAPDTAAPGDIQPETQPAGGTDMALAALEQSIIENNQLHDKVRQLEAKIQELDSALAAREEQIAELSQQNASDVAAGDEARTHVASVEGDTLSSALASKLDIRAIYAVTGTILAILLIAFFVRRMRRTNHEEAEEIVGAATFKPHRQ